MKDDVSTKRVERPEVEELSDLQWARIERGLWQRLDAAPAEAQADASARAPRLASALGRMRGLAFGGVLALAAAVALLVWVSRGERGEQGALVGEAPARVMTSESATTVSFAEAAIEVAPRSALLMSGSAERGATIVLERGRAGFHVAPRNVARPFVVVAGNAVVKVVGTRFEVARQGEEIEVIVREGKVDVRYLGQVHHVVAGERWSSPVATETAVLLDGGEAERADAAGDVSAGDANAGSDADADAGRRDDASATAAGTRRPARSGEPKPKPPATLDVEPPAAAPTDPPANATTDAPTSATDPSSDAQGARERKALAVEFLAAARLESSSPQEALRRYEALAKRDDRWGANALFAAARLAFDVGERDRGAALARAYLRRFPEGTNAPDARVLLRSAP